MKQVLKRTSIIAIALLTVFTIASAPAAFANDSIRVAPIELKFIGETNNQLIFQLDVTGSTEDNEFTIVIIDDAGNSVYRENVKGEKITKKFLLNEDVTNGNFRFQITSKKSNQTVVYKVSQVSRLVQDVVVNKLK